MGKTDLAYLAGFFDGEGNIYIQGLRPSRHCYNLSVRISQANRWILERYRMAFGGLIREIKPTSLTARGIWQWMIAGRQAMAFLKAIYPYLILKQGEAKIAIEFQSTRRKRGTSLTEEEWAIQEAQRLLVHNLKDKSKY